MTDSSPPPLAAAVIRPEPERRARYVARGTPLEKLAGKENPCGVVTRKTRRRKLVQPIPPLRRLRVDACCGTVPSEAQAIIGWWRAIFPVLVPELNQFGSAERRELFLAGLHFAAGEFD